MGSRGRSIRLRIYILVTIPLVTMLGLFSYVAITSARNYTNLNRAPRLIRATAEQATKFVNFIQQERRDAVVYLARPDTTALEEFQADSAQTKIGALAFEQAMTSAQTRSVQDPQEAAAIATMISDVRNLNKVRLAVEARKLTVIQAFDAYTNVILDEPPIFQAEANSMTDGSAVASGVGLISTVNEREDVDEQDSILAAALAAGTMTPEERVIFDNAAGREQDDQALFEKLLSPAELAGFNSQMDRPSVVQAADAVAQVQQAVEGGATISQIEAMGITPASWLGYTSTWADANYDGGLLAADSVLSTDQKLATTAKDEVILYGSIGAAGLILTLLISVLLGRSINRRLKILRTSARALATEQLPSVVARLRRGETVDVAAEAPPLRVGNDEIGQVGQAIDMVRQTAIRSAVEESKLRQGINDMFRNLARRNQSLLQRQLTVLDGMERRATDPDVLDDLFTMDHLTTRMRRHAEGLIILSGAAPGRSWSNPVKLIDVMRGAVSEVEDFARVTVATQSTAMLAGNAVTDVIHLLAELIENATSLSPPFTQVRVSGESVSNGFAIEIEDRGLGLTPNRMAELNERLANPPDVNPANTEQLGLFVVGKLARRHGITVMLRPSPYGGTTAVTLIPRELIVDDGKPALGAGPVAISAGTGSPAPSPEAAGGQPASGGEPGADGAAGGEATPFPRRTSRARGLGHGTRPGGTSLPPAMPVPGPAPVPTPVAGVRPAPAAHGTPPDLDSIPLSSPFGVQRPAAPRRTAPPGQGTDADIPVVTGVPVSWPADPPSPGYFTRPRGYAGAGYAAPGGNGNGNGAGGNGNGSHGGNGSNGNGHDPGGSARTGGYPDAAPGGPAETVNGLPRRVRQASLAPQLRQSRAAGRPAGAAVPQAVPPNPADVRNTFSAMQRGWQQGRSQQNRHTEGS